MEAWLDEILGAGGRASLRGAATAAARARIHALRPYGDRATAWGNPFVLGRDGDRATVIARYRDDYLPRNPGLLVRLGELRGQALGCWCAPQPCHADVLIEEMERRGSRRSAPPRNARRVTVERRC